MIERELFRMQTPYREDLVVKGYQFGKGQKAACIVGPVRGNEIQQLYVCSQLVKALKELEQRNCISNNKEILVIPVVNTYSINVEQRFFGPERVDINRSFPGNPQGETTYRIAAALTEQIKDYSYGIQFASFYMTGEFVPHVRMMENGYQNASLANLFGLPYVMLRQPAPIDTKTLSFNWQNEMTAAFSVYTNKNAEIDEKSASQAVSAVLRFLTRMGIIKYESHSGYISHVLNERDLKNVYSSANGLFRSRLRAGDEVRYGNPMADIIDPYTGEVKETIVAPTDGIVFFAYTEPIVGQYDVVYRLIHRLHR
jgi:predicted deacylase